MEIILLTGDNIQYMEQDITNFTSIEEVKKVMTRKYGKQTRIITRDERVLDYVQPLSKFLEEGNRIYIEYDMELLRITETTNSILNDYVDLRDMYLKGNLFDNFGKNNDSLEIHYVKDIDKIPSNRVNVKFKSNKDVINWINKVKISQGIHYTLDERVIQVIRNDKEFNKYGKLYIEDTLF